MCAVRQPYFFAEENALSVKEKARWDYENPMDEKRHHRIDGVCGSQLRGKHCSHFATPFVMSVVITATTIGTRMLRKRKRTNSAR